MCEGSASIAVDCDGVEGACGGREVLSISLLMRPRSDCGRSCERVIGLAREETGDSESGSDSSHAEEFRFGVGYKRDGHHICDGGCVLSPLASRDSRGTSR